MRKKDVSEEERHVSRYDLQNMWSVTSQRLSNKRAYSLSHNSQNERQMKLWRKRFEDKVFDPEETGDDATRRDETNMNM